MIYTLVERGYSIEILALTEREGTIDSDYGNETQIKYSVFNGNKVHFIAEVWRRALTHHYEYIIFDHVNLAASLSLLSFICSYRVWLCGIEAWPESINWEGKLGLLRASQRLAISEFTASKVKKKFQKLDIDVCELALDPLRYNPEIPIENNANFEALDGTVHQVGDRVILFVGRMAPGRFKGQESLLGAMPTILSKFPDAQLFLVGDGEDFGRIKQIAESLPASAKSSIFLPGHLSEEHLHYMFANCYLFAMPSRGEGFGFVYIEAMSYGKPCIGSHVDAASCLIEHERTGLLVSDPTSGEEVAKAIATLLDEPEIARSYGKAGKEKVEACYLFPQFRERFWKCLEIQ